MNNIQPKTLFIGKNSIYLPTCHSTNDIAAEMIQRDDVFDGTIVITSNQTAGRGQRGNSWETLPGQNITLSLIVKPNFLTANEQFQLNIAISLGIREFLLNAAEQEHVQFTNFRADDLKIKWPNDIYFGDRKMGGVLIENTLSGSRIAYSVIGMGLNINQIDFGDNEQLASRATSLRAITPKMSNHSDEYDLEKLIENLCESIEKYYLQLKNGHAASQKEWYIRNLYRYQETHFFMKNDLKFLGQIIGIDTFGRLAMDINGQIHYFDFKEISFVI